MRPVREASLARPPGTGGILGARRAPGELCLKLTELGYECQVYLATFLAPPK